MIDVLNLIDNAMLQGLGYGLAVLGVMWSFRIIRYPDLTCDGSFLLGAVVFAVLVNSQIHWLFAIAIAAFVGCASGCFTALIHWKLGVNRLLSGILTSMICYSLAFHIVSEKSTLAISDSYTMFSLVKSLDFTGELRLHLGSLIMCACITTLGMLLTFLLLKSELGLLLRATGENRIFVENLGRQPQRYQVVGLGIANAFIGMSGAVIAGRQGFANVNMGLGIIIVLIAALIMGEEVMRQTRLDVRRSLWARVLSTLVGSFVYYLLFLIVLRASIRGWFPIMLQPTDLNMISAIIVIAVIALRSHTAAIEDILPL